MGWTDDLGLFLIEDRLKYHDWVMIVGSKGPPVMANDDLELVWVRPALFRLLPDPPETGIRQLADGWKSIATAPDVPLPFDMLGWCPEFGMYPMTRHRPGNFAMQSSTRAGAIKDGDNPAATLPVNPTHWRPVSDMIPPASFRANPR